MDLPSHILNLMQSEDVLVHDVVLVSIMVVLVTGINFNINVVLEKAPSLLVILLVKFWSTPTTVETVGVEHWC